MALLEADVDPDPIEQFRRWLDDAVAAGIREPTAMVLATADAQGRPSARNVLLKGVDERGFTFFTNEASRKGRELAANPRAALVFSWIALERQVLVTGDVAPVDAAEADDYFATRARGSQIGAWASHQSEVIPDRETLEARAADVARRFDGQPVPRPSYWGGFRVTPITIEFWNSRPNRLHDRLRYRRPDGGKPDGGKPEGGDTDGRWVIERLNP